MHPDLGPPHSYTLNPGDRPALIAWAIDYGYPSAMVHSMGSVDLANLYCGGAVSPTDAQQAAARALEAVLPLIGTKVDAQAVRAIVREELERLAPRSLIVSSPAATVSINGPMHYATPKVIRTIARGHAAMLVGPAGCGKTHIGQTVATALARQFYITSAVNETHEIMGFVDGYGKYHRTAFRNAFERGGIWIADEIDAWDAGALLVANSALANGIAQFPDAEEPVRRHADFTVCATANTFGMGADRVYVGRNELDAASLDRFAVIEVGYDTDLERMFAGGHDKWLEYVWDVRRSVTELKIRHVVSSRAIRSGAEALADGDEWNDVCDAYLFKGMSGKDRERIS